MPVLQFSAAMLEGLLNGSQADSPAKGGDIAGNAVGANGKSSGGGQFSSLLNILGNPGGTDKQPQNISRKDEVKDPAAVAVDAPGQFRAKADNNQESQVRRTAQPLAAKGQDEKPDRTPANVKNNDKAAVNGPQRQPSRLVPEQGDAKEAQAAAGDAAPDDVVAPQKLVNAGDGLEELKEKISGHFTSLDNLMEIIAQWLAGDNVQVAAHIDMKSGVTQQAGAITENNMLNSGASGQATQLMEVFTGLKDTLSQLQQFLQSAGGQETPLSQEQAAQLVSINNALQGELDSLKALLPQAANETGKKTGDVPLLPVLPAETKSKVQELLVVAEDIKPILQKDISLIKDMLQKFKGEPALSPAKSEAATSSPLFTAQAASVTVTTGGDNNMPIATESKKAETAVFSNAAALPAVEQNISQQVLPAQNNAVANIAPVAGQAVAPSLETQTGSGGNFNSNSGQGGSPQAQIAVNATGATSTQAATGANATRFSSMLNRSGQTPVAEQVAFQVKTALGSGNSKITIQLNPEELGKLDITLDVDAKGKTGVTITADNKQALDLLQRDSGGLQKALADAGLKADTGSLSFNLRGGQQEGQGQSQSQAANQYRKSQPDEPQPENLNIASVTRSYVVNLPDGLDIKI